MDWIYEMFQGLLEPFDSDDKSLIKTYWSTIFKAMLTPYQRDLELDLAESAITVLPRDKTFYYAFVPEYDSKEIIITSTPYELPEGVKSVTCYGHRTFKEEEMELPVTLPADAEDITTSSPTAIIDGIRVIGTGLHFVKYSSGLVTDYDISERILTSSKTIIRVLADISPSVPVVQRGYAIVLDNGHIRDLDKSFVGTLPGSKIRLYGHLEYTVREVVDNHTLRLSSPGGAPGIKIRYDLNKYQYSFPTEFESIPSFGSMVEHRDFAISDGVIGFVNPPDETLIARTAFKKNSLMVDRFMQFLDVYPDDREEMLAFWRAIFAGANMEPLMLFIHAMLGFPYTLPGMGTQTVDDIEYEESNIKDHIDFTATGIDNKIEVDIDYFTGTDTCIKLEDGTFLKVIRFDGARRIEVDRVPFTGTVNGYAATITTKTLTLIDDVGAYHHSRIPPNTVPRFKVGDAVGEWERLTSGVRIFDRVNRSNYTDFENSDRFMLEGATPHVDTLDWLSAHTFAIEIDQCGPIDDRLIRYLLPSWTQYHLRCSALGDGILIEDNLFLIDSILLRLGKHFSSSMVALVSGAVPAMENKCLHVPEIPPFFYGVYNALNGVIDTIAGPSGAAWAASGPVNVCAYDSNYDNIPSAYAVGYAEGPNIRIVSNAGVLPGGHTQFMLVEESKMISSSIIMRSGGVFPGGLLTRVKDSGTIGFLSKKFNRDTIPYYVEGVIPSENQDYMPSIYNIGDIVVDDQHRLEYPRSEGFRINGGIIDRTDFERLGVKLGSHVVISGLNDQSIFQVINFTDHGEPVLNNAPVDDTFIDIKFCAFALRHDDGTVTIFAE